MTTNPPSRGKLHTEEALEIHLVEQLVTRQGWRERPANGYDPALALDPEMLVEFIRTTQPEVWEKLFARYKDHAAATLVQQTEKALRAVGTLEVLRGGIKIVPGIKISMCFFKPSANLNEPAVRRYESNILTVTRQVRYSAKNGNAIDVVLFVNGLPIATLELKNTMTGSNYQTAEKQYRSDRKPAGEPLLTFKRGALVHFALDQDNVSMTTDLNGAKTRFMPFNRGRDGGAGNADIEDDFRIAYLYRDLDGAKAVLSRDTLLGILHKFLLIDEVSQDDGSVKRVAIWPRFQQLDAVQRLAADARANGPGRNYLFQHSAGSGKSNTIAWAAHHLSTLHDDNDQAIFDTVIVVTDRVVLDQQLQKTIGSFSRTQGYVAPIDGTSRQLRKALEEGAKIIISTIHKFSSEQLEILDSQAGKRFAIIVDEAHSSQSGKHSDSMSGILSGGHSAESDVEMDLLERELLACQHKRGPQSNLSYAAFTATPKGVTLERFGEPSDQGPRPFHLYSMRQAIEEGFILDVLGNYQTYKSYAKLEKAIEDNPRLLQRKSNRAVARFIDFHETSMGQKAEVIVEHFRRHALPELEGAAKAMVVTASREHAVRTRDAITRYIADQGYTDVRALVAFSGEVEVNGDVVTEPGINGFSEKELPRQFDGGAYNVLVVAEKYQTGFDQPKLIAMYIDRHLSGVQAVQTLARLNRIYPDKDRIFILDFRNSIEDIQAAFAPYYNATQLADVSDPNQIYTLEQRLRAFAVLADHEIDSFAAEYLSPEGPGPRRPVLENTVRKAAQRFSRNLSEDDQEEFRQVLSSFLRFYSFIAQIVELGDPDLEKLHLYGSWLTRLLPTRHAPQGGNVTDDMLELEAYVLKKDACDTDARLASGTAAALDPIERFGANPYTEEEELALSSIISSFNERHGTDFSKDDYLRFEAVNSGILDDEDWADLLRNNDPADVKGRFDKEFMRRAIATFKRDAAMKEAFTRDEGAREALMELMFKRAVAASRT